MTGLPASGSPDTLYVVDLLAYVFRAYHSLSPLTSPNGEPTHATFLTMSMLSRIITDRDPKLMAIAVDSKSPSFRKSIDKNYKANRPPPPEDLPVQIERILGLIGLWGLQVWHQPGFEADDVIASAVRKATAEGLQVVIASADKDLLQLVGPRVVMWDAMRDKVYGPNEVVEKFGVRPEQMRDLLALMGDSSDNVKGVPSVGPKKAAMLLSQYGTIEGIYGAIDQIKGKLRENLVAHRDSADLARELVTLREDLDIGIDKTALDFRPRYNAEGLRTAYATLGFSRLRETLRQPQETSTVTATRYVAVHDQATLQSAVQACREAGMFAFTTEISTADPMRANLVGISLACHPHEAWYIPIGHHYLNAPSQLPLDLVREALNPLLASTDVRKACHHVTHHKVVLRRHGFDSIRAITSDTMIESYLLDPEDSHRLEDVARRALHVDRTNNKRASLESEDIARATDHTCTNADHAMQVHHAHRPLLAQQDQELRDLLEDVELPLAHVLVEMEMAGVLLDVRQLHELGVMLRARMGELEARAKAQVGRDFNVGSPRQLETILFDELKLPAQKHTKTARSTDASVLEALVDAHPVVRTILDLRQLSKLLSTYVETLPGLVHPETGRIHTRYNQNVTATGRLSSKEPNLQNIPVRTEEGRALRRAFIAEQGHVIVSADYSQIELRVLAHLSKDPALLDAFRNNDDIHQRTAMEIFGEQAWSVTSEQRRVAKVVNFGVMYGMGDLALSKKLGVSRSAAKKFIEQYFAQYGRVRSFMDATIETARKEHKVRTLLGRQRHLPDLHNPNDGLRAQAERMAINTPIQGTAADLLKLAMIRLAEPVVEGAKMILTVHDELVFEIPSNLVSEAVPRIRRAMESVMPLDVPLQVDVGVGHSWAEAH